MSTTIAPPGAPGDSKTKSTPKLARRADVRNIAIIAHVDHGKTTLVDCMLRQSGQFRAAQLVGEQILDSNDLERERGITILAKNISVPYKDVKINIIDTPGHADFGGEVERVLRMADGALVLVDAAEGPMPQTRFVLSKALECRLQPIVVINKIDRPDARPAEVVSEVLDLFLQLGADDELADFPYIFASSREGFASHDASAREGTIAPLMDMILERIPGPIVEADSPLQMLVTNLDWSDYVGRIAIGRIHAGRVKKGQDVLVMQAAGNLPGRIAQVHVFENLGRVETTEVDAGDIVALVGLEDIDIGDTISDPLTPRALPRLHVDEPTLRMTFGTNTSPFAGQEGKFLTSRNLRDRLFKELERNVALRVEPIVGTEQFSVSGRGVLHLAILIETMRREGYELSIGKPQVILRTNHGVTEEPYETLVIEVPDEHLGAVMEMVGMRRGQLLQMSHRNEFAHTTFSIPARGLIGLRTRMLNATQGTAVMHHRYEGYRPIQEAMPGRANGVLISIAPGRVAAFSLDTLQERASMFVAPGDLVYEGMIVGENSRDDDMNVNPTKEKKLTNMRAAGKDRNILLRPPRRMTLEEALEYVAEDELVEVTPNQIRLRKIILTETDRRRLARKNA